MVISLPTSKTTSVAVGEGVIVLVAVAVGVWGMGDCVKIGELGASKSALVDASPFADGIMVTVAREGSPEDCGNAHPPSPAKLQLAVSTMKMNIKIKFFFASIPIKPL